MENIEEPTFATVNFGNAWVTGDAYVDMDKLGNAWVAGNAYICFDEKKDQ